MRVSKVYEGTDPGNTPGRPFVASINQEEIIPEGRFLDSLSFGLQGAVSTAAVAIEASIAGLSEYTLRVGPETRVLMNLRQLCALMLFYYGQLPFIWENTDATGFNFVGGVKVPIKAPVDAAKPITHAAAWATQTNIATETLAISAYWEDDVGGAKPIHAVAIGHTTAASAGYETLGFRIAPVGTLIGLIIQQVAPFADGDVDISVQRIKILANGQLHTALNSLSDGMKWAGRSVGVLDPMDDLMNPFTIFDLRPSGIDAKGQELTLQLDIQDVSDAITIIPILEVA